MCVVVVVGSWRTGIDCLGLFWRSSTGFIWVFYGGRPWEIGCAFTEVGDGIRLRFYGGGRWEIV